VKYGKENDKDKIRVNRLGKTRVTATNSPKATMHTQTIKPHNVKPTKTL